METKYITEHLVDTAEGYKILVAQTEEIKDMMEGYLNLDQIVIKYIEKYSLGLNRESVEEALGAVQSLPHIDVRGKISDELYSQLFKIEVLDILDKETAKSEV